MNENLIDRLLAVNDYLELASVRAEIDGRYQAMEAYVDASERVCDALGLDLDDRVEARVRAIVEVDKQVAVEA